MSKKDKEVKKALKKLKKQKKEYEAPPVLPRGFNETLLDMAMASVSRYPDDEGV